jgi:hypothetical protein
LSQACLGKIIIFSIEWRGKGRISHLPREQPALKTRLSSVEFSWCVCPEPVSLK